MDHNVIAAERYIAGQEDAAEAMCVETAIKNGFTPEQANLCDDGDVGCLDCPFATCEMCERRTAKQTIQAQTIPGSLDTKFVDMRVCNDCASDYQTSLVGIWNKKDIL